MRKLFVLLLITSLVIVGLTIVEYSVQTDKAKQTKLQGLIFVSTSHDTIEYNSTVFPKYFILNYLDSSCPLCTIELNELIGYVKRKPKTMLIIASSENLEKLILTETFIKSRLIGSNGKIEVVQINQDEALKIFPDLSTPQIAIFGDSLKLLQVKQG